ncbi:YppG family protein [Bacillus massiliglaciei]|uniref:YppG family protein n=1 Tax=Bacillus massiliglaciei TaxID=1816693 RepID=UPI001F318F0E|nr:YppG family protein [Bacillus massiliglaciei]
MFRPESNNGYLLPDMQGYGNNFPSQHAYMPPAANYGPMLPYPMPYNHHDPSMQPQPFPIENHYNPASSVHNQPAQNPYQSYPQPAQPVGMMMQGQMGPAVNTGLPLSPKGPSQVNFFENPLQSSVKSAKQFQPPSYSHPYPKQQFMQKQPSGFKTVINQFKTQDGSIDVTKMMNTAGQMMSTFTQVSSMVKGVGSFFKIV